MTSAELERLTQLAERAFRGRCFGRVRLLHDSGVDVETKAGGLLLCIAAHPRALEALEVALVVLTTEEA